MKVTSAQRGFTLLELMTVLVIIVIIISIAYPSYVTQVLSTRRSEGQALLMRVAAQEERFFTNNNQYIDDVTAAPVAGLGMAQDTSENGHYQVAAAIAGGGTSYTLTATPQGGQATDTLCANLTLTSAGAKGASGTTVDALRDCWQ